MSTVDIDIIPHTALSNHYLKLEHQGKVRDSYSVFNLPKTRAIVASDRVSAFDVVMAQTIPGKGRILTAMSADWFRYLETIGLVFSPKNPPPAPALLHHMIDTGLRELPLTSGETERLNGRTTTARNADFVLPIECIVRGYLEGTGWASYQKTQTVCGLELPAGLIRCSKLPKPIFTPSSKAIAPFHDENISYDQMVETLSTFSRMHELGLDCPMLAEEIRNHALAIYAAASAYAEKRGIIIADTKYEFGLIEDDGKYRLMLIDEVLTSDSSRYWDKNTYEPGRAQASFDKQPLRDWLQALCDRGEWNKKAPGPVIDEDILAITAARYTEILHRLFG